MSVVRFELLLWLLIWKHNKGGRLKSRSDCSINWGKWISKLLLSVWNACISLWYMFGSNGIGDGLTCPHWLILMMKRMGITKGNVINCLCVLCWERVEGLLNHCWCNFMFVWLWTVRCYENGHLLIICVNLSSASFWGIGCGKCYVHWEIMGT